MRKHVLSLTLGILLLVTLPILVVQSQQLQSIRTILNDVWDRANHQLMGQPWIGGSASGQSIQTEQTIYNDVWDAPNHMLRVSATGGGGSGGPFNLITSGTNTGQTLTVGNTSILAPQGTGIIKSTVWNTLPSPCGTNAFATGQDTAGNMVCTQVPFTGLTGAASDAQVPDLSTLSTGLTPSRCVETDVAGKLTSAAAVCGSGSGGGAPTDAHYLTTQAETGLSAESNLGALTTGLLKIAVSAGVATPSIAIAGTDYGAPLGFTPPPNTRTLTINGTTNQIAVTGGTQDLSANRTWTIALPTNVTIPGTTTGTFSGPLTGNATSATNVGFSGLQSGTNNAAAMHVGSGASLDAAGGGTIDATNLAGLAGSAYAKLAGGGTQVLTGTQVDNRAVAQTVTANAFTPNLDTTGIAVVPVLTAGVTVNQPSPATGGNPKDYHELSIVFQPTAAPRSITWNAIYSAQMGLTLPTSTTGDNATWDMVKFFYIPTVAKYVLAASTIGVEPGITTLGTSSTYTCPHLTSRGCEMAMTGAAGTVTIAIPSGGAPANGKQLTLKIKCTNLQDLTLDTSAGGFIASPNVPITGLTCPAAGPSWTAIGAEYSTVLTRWQVYATN